MNCRKFNEYLPEYLSGELNDNDRAEMERHATECGECRRELEDAATIVETLTPQCIITPSAGFEERIISAVQAAHGAQNGDPKMRKGHRALIIRLATGMLSAAAVIAVVLTAGLNSTVRAARNQINNAIAALDHAESMVMEFQVRTKAHENFSYTDPHLDFVNHRLEVVYTPQLMWRMTKSGHIAVSNGLEIHQWWPAVGTGSVTSTDSGVLAELEALIDPRMLMHMELELTQKIHGAKYEITNDGNSTYLTVENPAQGDFSQSDYTLYNSIIESDTRREYTFSEDGKLVAASVTFLHPEGDVTLLKVNRITYDAPIDTAMLTALPENMTWNDMRTALENATLVDITAEEAVGRIIAAMHSWEEPAIEALQVYGEKGRELLRQKYEGARLLTMKKAVRSGRYAGIFVPCTLLLRDSTRKELMLAMRNDTLSGGWIVDGGL